MAFCDEPVKFPYFTISRVYRDNASMHYAFIGIDMAKKHNELFKRMSNGNIPGKNDIEMLKTIFGEYTVDLWVSIIEGREPLIFINDMIWTDDTIFKIKAKLLVYLSKPKNTFLLPDYQQLWMNIDGANKILGMTFEKQTPDGVELISYDPAIDNVPEIDTSILSEDDEFINIIPDREDNMLLFDTIGKLYKFGKLRQYEPRIFLYVLTDESEWIQNNPLVENDNPVSKKRLLNGYFKKHWPIANPKVASLDANLKLYNDVKRQILNVNEIISTVRFNETVTKYPKLEECIIWKMTLWTRPPRSEGMAPYRLDMVYNYLRTLLSDEMPFVYYTRYGDKAPNVSIYEKSVEKKALPIKTIQTWVFKKLPTGQQVPKGRAGTILIKLYNYSTKEGIAKYINLTLFRNSEISVGLSFEEYTESSVKDIENAVAKVTNIISKLNDEFLKHHKHPLYSVPKLKIEDGEFIFSEYMTIQFYEVISTFKTKNIFDFSDFSKFIENYKPFVDILPFSDSKENIIQLKLQYKRINYDDKLLDIFEFIEKEKTMGTRSETIVELIMKRFGKTRVKASEIYNHWRILQIDKQIAKELLKRPGVSIELKRSEDFEITDEKNKYKYKIFISGLKSLYILRNCYSFLQSVISFYYNKDKKGVIKKDIIAEKDINIAFGINNDEELPSLPLDNVNFNENLNTNDITISTNFNENLEPNRNNNRVSNVEFSSTGNIDMTDESGLDPKIRLKCSSEENKLVNKGTCKNVCDFPKFKLNRLQHFEPKIFRFKAKRHSQPYSRKCEEPRRPIVMAYDPAKNTKISKKAYTYSIKYKSSKEGSEYYYICPQAWCPICEIPIPMENLKNIKTKMTKDGLCEFATCPHGNHQVIINSKGMKELYPGFLDPVGNPNGFCMPCCFKNNKTKSIPYKRCIETEENNENKDELGKKYISRREKIPLAEGRLGLLPEDIEIFLEQKSCYTGNIKSGFDCLVRKGVNFSKVNSFMNVMIDLVSGLLGEKITKKDFIERLTSGITDQLFNSLTSGLIKRQFKTKKNYIEFLLTASDKIPKIYIWDIVSRPGVFRKEGFNIVIFTPHSIFCPYGQNASSLYSLNKPTLLIIKFGHTYEPIYRVQYTDGKLQYTYLQNSTDPVIQKAVETAKKGCAAYDEIYWNKASTINRTYKIKENISLNNLIEDIHGKYTIKLQLVDDYSKTTGVILNNGLYLPVKPSLVSMDYPYLTANTDADIPLLSFDKTIKLLNEFNKQTSLEFKPVYLIVHKRDVNTVVGILLETNRVIPIIPINLSKLKTTLKPSDIFYYPDADTKNISNTTKLDRIRAINEYQYKIESFERFKYEISRYLQTTKGKGDRDKIIKIVEKPIVSKKDIDTLKKIITKLTKTLVATPSKSKKKLESVLKSKDKYYSTLLRSACFILDKKAGDEDSHCVCTGNTCKLVGLIKTDFTDRLADILLRYPIQREEILRGTISMIDLSSSLQKHQDDELLLTGNKIDDNFSKLIYTDKKRYQLKLIRNVDMAKPTFEGVNKKAYLRIRKGMEKDIKTYSVVDLSQHWLSIMNPIFRMISTNDPCDSLYYSISEFAKQITTKYLGFNKLYKVRKNVDIKDITVNNIRDVYANFILTLETNDLQNLVKNVLHNITDEELEDIIDVSDFYNLYNEKDKVNSVDELVERIKVGHPSYKPNKFDVVMLAYMININIILLRSSISEVVGKGFVENELYCVLFYDPIEHIPCIRFYMLQKGALPYVSTLKSEIKRLITN